jgi:hypothetical protein
VVEKRCRVSDVMIEVMRVLIDAMRVLMCTVPEAARVLMGRCEIAFRGVRVLVCAVGVIIKA